MESSAIAGEGSEAIYGKGRYGTESSYKRVDSAVRNLDIDHSVAARPAFHSKSPIGPCSAQARWSARRRSIG